MNTKQTPSRDFITTATLAELKETAVYQHGELRISLSTGQLYATLILDNQVELWGAAVGSSILSENATMFREARFSANRYPDWTVKS